MKIKTLVGMILSTLTIYGHAAPITMISDPEMQWKEVGRELGSAPSVDKASIEGVSVGQAVSGTPGKTLFEVTTARQHIDVVFKVLSDVDLQAQGAELPLKAGAELRPYAQLMSRDGKTSYYLLHADRAASTFMRFNRFFLFSENSGLLDHTFRLWAGAVEGAPNYTFGWTNDTVTPPTTGDIEIDKQVTTGAPDCRVAVVYLGESQGTSSFKVIRSDANGNVTASKVTEYMPDIETIKFPGAIINVSKMNSNAIQGKVSDLQSINCQGDL